MKRYYCILSCLGVLSLNAQAGTEDYFKSNCISDGGEVTETTVISSLYKFDKLNDTYLISSVNDNSWFLKDETQLDKSLVELLIENLETKNEFIGCVKNNFLINVWLGGATLTSSDEELIKNGDMEKGSEYWYSSQKIEASHPASTYGLSNSGHGNIVLEVDNSRTDGFGVIQQNIKLKKGKEYKFEFDYAGRKNYENNQGFYIQIDNSPIIEDFNVSSSWKHFTGTFKSKTTGNVSLSIVPTGIVDGAGIILDNFSLKLNK
ncbi:TPA: carbohydrate binding domain-containing protein [Photobacterium damselae]